MLKVSARLIFLILGVAATAAWAQPTYSKEVSRILQRKCQMCHRPGDIAPFPLLSYDDARAQSRAMLAAVFTGIMPPWKPVPGHGDFKNNLSLTEEDRKTILDWIEAGAPEGDPADLPAPVPNTSEWRIGEPDQTLSMPVPYTPVAREDRPDRYRCFVLPAIVDQDRWVRAVDVAPGLRQVVHHVLLYMTDNPEQIRLTEQMEVEDPEPGYDCWGGPRITPAAGPGLIPEAGGLLGGWVPGANVAELPPEIGILVPKGVYLVMQVHYNLDEVKEPPADLTRVGLYFHTKPPKNRLLTLPLLNDTFVLEPGEMGKQVDAAFKLDLGAVGLPLPDAWVPAFSAIRIGPHMHTLGREIRSDLVKPDGTETPLVKIDNWDFHWQGLYDYVTPIPMPYRSTIKLSCKFDNTTDRQVRWGESTKDEMCLVYLGFTAEGGLSSLIFGNPQ